MDKFIERALLLGEILETGSPEHLAKMFQPNHPQYSEITINFIPFSF
jgi:hypothetical protein